MANSDRHLEAHQFEIVGVQGCLFAKTLPAEDFLRVFDRLEPV